MSIQAYCSRNNVPYKVLDKWIRDIYKRVFPVQVTGTLEELKTEKKASNDNVSLKINISTSSEMELCKDGLDYTGLKMFIEKPEDLLC